MRNKLVKYYENKTIMISLLLSLATVAGLAASSQDIQHYFEGAKNNDLVPTSTDRIIVKFKPSVKEDTRQVIYKKNGLTKKKEIMADMVVVGSGNASNVQNKIKNLKADKNVEFVEVDHLVSPDAINQTIPNDPNFISQYYLHRIMAPRAWYYQKATNIKVGICDAGFEATHPDLSGAFLSNLGYNTVDGTNNWAPVNYHGTMVAGTVAATANNTIGLAGVSWGAKIIPVRVSNTTDGRAYESDIDECIVYAANNGAKVINVSYSILDKGVARTSAANYAESKGAIVVNSAGNGNRDEGYIDTPSIIYVSALSEYNSKASFSSFGNYVDVTAPGSYIYTTDLNGGYKSVSGTSFSSPITAGVIALIWAKNPTASVATIKQILTSSTDDLGTIGEDIYFGKGAVNACKAILGTSSANCLPLTNKFSNLSANLGEPNAVFNFSYPTASDFVIDISSTKDFSADVYRTFGTGKSSPVTVTDPGKLFKYQCGAKMWWIVKTLDGTAFSPMQEGTVNCGTFSNMSTKLTANRAEYYYAYSGNSPSFIIYLSSTPVQSNAYAYLSYSSPLIVTNPSSWPNYKCGNIFYWKVVSQLQAESPFVGTFVDCPSMVPVLSSPLNNSIVNMARPTLDWEDLPTWYSYRVQVSTDTQFTNLLVDNYKENKGYPDSSYIFSFDIPVDKPIYWRVRAENPFGAHSWSKVYTFTYKTPTVTPNICFNFKDPLGNTYLPKDPIVTTPNKLIKLIPQYINTGSVPQSTFWNIPDTSKLNLAMSLGFNSYSQSDTKTPYNLEASILTKARTAVGSYANVKVTAYRNGVEICSDTLKFVIN